MAQIIRNIRQIAAVSLDTWEEGHVYAETLIEQGAKDNQLSGPDRNLLNALVMGAIRHQRALDHIIDSMREGRLDPLARQVLRIGIFQLLWMELPVHAAVNETVNSARKGVRGLINAILRRTDRERETILDSLKTLPADIKLSHPAWLYNHWVSSFGEQDTASLMKWNQQPAPTFFRVNRLRCKDTTMFDSDERSVALDLPDYYQYKGIPPKEWLSQGLIYIQDPATRHSIELLSPSKGEDILDACAAPGGKAAQIGSYLNNSGSILCTDSNKRRLPRLQKNLENLGITCASTEQHDWTKPAPQQWHGQFDGILLDVPCSNTGVLRRRVDARWRMTPESIHALTNIQNEILTNTLPCLKPKGRIVYSTCSIESVENSEIIQAFLNKHPKLELIKEVSILPHIAQTDGAYSALLQLKQ